MLVKGKLLNAKRCQYLKHSDALRCHSSFLMTIMVNNVNSTFFNCMSKLHVPAENFPFCTIEPNTAMVSILSILNSSFRIKMLRICKGCIARSTIQLVM